MPCSTNFQTLRRCTEVEERAGIEAGMMSQGSQGTGTHASHATSHATPHGTRGTPHANNYNYGGGQHNAGAVGVGAGVGGRATHHTPGSAVQVNGHGGGYGGGHGGGGLPPRTPASVRGGGGKRGGGGGGGGFNPLLHGASPVTPSATPKNGQMFQTPTANLQQQQQQQQHNHNHPLSAEGGTTIRDNNNNNNNNNNASSSSPSSSYAFDDDDIDPFGDPLTPAPPLRSANGGSTPQTAPTATTTSSNGGGGGGGGGSGPSSAGAKLPDVFPGIRPTPSLYAGAEATALEVQRLWGNPGRFVSFEDCRAVLASLPEARSALMVWRCGGAS